MTNEEFELIHDALVFARQHIQVQLRSVKQAIAQLDGKPRDVVQAWAIQAKVEHTLETIEQALGVVHQEAEARINRPSAHLN